MPSVYEVVTERIIAKLEAGTVPWRQPWAGGAEGAPKNLKSGKAYRGVNVLLLGASGYASPWWVSYRQAQELGGQVRKGEKGTPVVFWLDSWKRATEDGTEEEVRRPVLRYYTVFNASQCDGLTVPAAPATGPACEPIPACEAIVKGMPRAPRITHGGGQAFYRPADDSVTMPAREAFRGPEAFYSVLFHELTHATWHPSRLDRKGIAEVAPFGSRDYSQEELVAECGAAFLCGTAGIEPATLDDSASYIAAWVKRLRGDCKLVVVAASQAQKAADFILGRTAPASAAAGA